MSFKITWRTHVVCFLMAIIIRVIMGDYAVSIVEDFLFKEFIKYPTKWIFVNFYLYVLLLLAPITLVHEALHGAAYTFFGGRVKYGFKFIYAYAQEISEKPIEKYKFWIILLFPLFMISLMSLLLPKWLGGMVFFMNALGASGDIYMALILLKYKWNCKIVDRKYGFDVV